MTFTRIAPTVMQIIHVGVIFIERLYQGHLYPLGECRDKHVTDGVRTSDLLRRSTYRATVSRQLIRWLFGTST
jgi:hypothetical protein